jgi:hypothetical protein
VAVCLEVERASPSMLRSGLSSVAVSVLGVALYADGLLVIGTRR